MWSPSVEPADVIWIHSELAWENDTFSSHGYIQQQSITSHLQNPRTLPPLFVNSNRE